MRYEKYVFAIIECAILFLGITYFVFLYETRVTVNIFDCSENSTKYTYYKKNIYILSLRILFKIKCILNYFM